MTTTHLRDHGTTTSDGAPPGAVVSFDLATERLDVTREVIAVSGEVDLYAAPEFQRSLDAAIDGGARQVIVDLTGATFVDSTFLGALVRAMRRLRKYGGDIGVVCCDANLRKVFEITGLDAVITIRDDRRSLSGHGWAAPRRPRTGVRNVGVLH